MIKDQEVFEWIEWVENELEEPNNLSDQMKYVLEAFLESLNKIT
jgi:hypothetical protein